MFLDNGSGHTETRDSSGWTGVQGGVLCQSGSPMGRAHTRTAQPKRRWGLGCNPRQPPEQELEARLAPKDEMRELKQPFGLRKHAGA
jgi:hypothetical protein